MHTAILKLTPPRISSSPAALKRNSRSRPMSSSTSSSPKSQQKPKKPRAGVPASVRPVHILPELLEVDDEEEQPIDTSFMNLGNEDDEILIKRRNNKRASRTRSIGLNGLRDLAQGVESLLIGVHIVNFFVLDGQF